MSCFLDCGVLKLFVLEDVARGELVQDLSIHLAKGKNVLLLKVTHHFISM